MTQDLHPDTEAALLVPGLALSACVHAHLWRDTSRAQGLSEAQRSSWFPASPLCGLSWMLEGDGGEVDAQGTLRMLGSRCLLTGPRSGPVQYRAVGGLRCFMTAITPDALHALTGLDIKNLIDRCVPMEPLLDEEWCALNHRMLAAVDGRACQVLLEDFLRPRWQALGLCSDDAMRRWPREWLQNLSMRAIAGGHGRSLRQMERRIKQWSGQSLRALRVLCRGEASYQHVRRELQAGELVWSVVAQDMGYADQAHLCRESRRLTGFSPEELRLRVAQEESFWAYRVWT